MAITNIHEAKTHLSRLIERVAGGEEIVIGKAGRPIAKLVPYREKSRPKRKPGYWKGKVRMARDFDRPPAEVGAAFRGERG